MIWARWILGLVLATLFLFLAGAHATIVWNGLVRRRHTPSAVPLFVGLFGVAAAWVLPVPGLSCWWWLPLILDYGSVPLLVHTAIFWLFLHPRSR